MNRITPPDTPSAWLAQSGATLFFLVLLAGDLAFIGLHVFNHVGSEPGNLLLDIEQDHSYAEAYQYLKFLWIILMLSQVAWARRALHYLPWVLLFAYLLFDDALQIHEQAGSVLAARLDFLPPTRLRLQDYGELAVSAIAAIVLLGPLAWAYWRGTPAFRAVSRNLLLLLCALVFFGVGVDMVHIAFNSGPLIKFLLGMLEDGGELISASAIAWYSFWLMTSLQEHAVDFHRHWHLRGHPRRMAARAW